MGKVGRQSRAKIRKVRLEIRKVIAKNFDWQLAVDHLIKVARPKNKKEEKRARKIAISEVVSGNRALRDAAAAIFHNITGH